MSSHPDSSKRADSNRVIPGLYRGRGLQAAGAPAAFKDARAPAAFQGAAVIEQGTGASGAAAFKAGPG